MSKYKPRPGLWRQISGDINPSQHGAIIARYDGEAIELREIQPVREYVGDSEALDVGFPFWTKEAYYEPSDLDPTLPHVRAALDSCGYDDDEKWPLQIAECLLCYGHAVDEGPSGWARDVVPGLVRWWGVKRACGWRYLADEDCEFRALQREAQRRDRAA